MIDACSDPVPDQRVRRPRLKRRDRALRAATARGRAAGSRPALPRAGCRAPPCPRPSTSTHAKPLCPTAIARSVGSVTTAASARHVFTSASAPMLECSSSTTAATIEPAGRRGRRARRSRRPRRSSRRRRPSCPARRGRTSRPSRSTGVNGSRHAGDADRVGVAAEHQRAALRRVLRARRRRWAGRAATGLDGRRRGRCARISAATTVGDLPLARRAGHERRVDGVDGDEIAQQADGWIHRS